MSLNEKKKQLLKKKLMLLAIISGINAFSVNAYAKKNYSKFEAVEDLSVTSVNTVTALVNVNIRTLPSTKGNKIGVLTKGSKLEK